MVFVKFWGKAQFFRGQSPILGTAAYAYYNIVGIKNKMVFVRFFGEKHVFGRGGQLPPGHKATCLVLSELNTTD